MRTKIVTLALVGGLGLTGAALLTPSLASADTATATAGTGNPLTDRIAAVRKALAGLVTDQTLTPAQADKVAGTLAQRLPDRGFDGGPGGRRGGRGGVHLSPDDTAAALGISVADLRAGREAGRTLAQIAAAKGIGKADLVNRLVQAAKADLAADVSSGRLTQAQADQVSSGLTARVTERVDRVGGPGGEGGRHHGGPDGDADDAPGATPAPSSATTPGA